MIGSSLSHYRIVDKLGEGGMGVVWKALDTELDREVAVKVLPEQFAEEPERLARFEREAKVLASLNHRNIAAIYGLAREEGQRFLVMELVEGEDLAQKLLRGPLPVDEAIDIGHQLARALDAAHEKGILHRDLKPANVQITPAGQVKVLDFGLAKEFQADGVDQSKSPTLTSAGTQAGTILGTAGYMSPEQARGKPVDKRTDIWAFGCVLYECLTGRSAFVGETLSDTLATILKGEPNWNALPEATPPRVRELLERCLTKDLKTRLRDIGDARVELQRLASGGGSSVTLSGPSVTTAAMEPTPRSFPLLGFAATLVLGLALGAGLWAGLFGSARGSSDTAAATRFSITIPAELAIANFGFVASPAGDAIGFVATPRDPETPKEAVAHFYTRSFDDFIPKRVPGTEGMQFITYSPDGRWAAVLAPVAPQSAKLRLSKVSVDGSSPPLALVDFPDHWIGPLTWLPGGDILGRTADGQSLIRIPSDGGAAREPIPIRPEGYQGLFVNLGTRGSVLPDGKHVLGNVVTWGEEGYDWSVALLDVDTGESRILVENGGCPQYRSSGHLLFTRGDTLLAVPFDADSLTVRGAQVALADGLRTTSLWEDAWFDVSPSGSLLHLAGGVVGANRRFVFLDASYEILGPWSTDRGAFEGMLTVSDDGSRVAVTVVNPEGLYDIWVSDMDPPRLSRLVTTPGEDCNPHVWHPDNRHLFYSCSTSDSVDLWVRDGDGIDPPRLLHQSDRPGQNIFMTDFWSDGSALLVTHWADNKSELLLLPFDDESEGARTPRPFLDGAAWSQLSPDGRLLAYVTRASGRDEVYVRTLDSSGRVGREYPVTRDGCAGPIWRSTEAAPELWYSCQSKVYAVTVSRDAGVRISRPRLIADNTKLFRELKSALGLLPDGGFLAALQGDEEQTPSEISVTLNWLAELETRMAGEN